MTKAKIKKMILALLEYVDYDLYKSFLPNSSELDEDTLESEMDELVAIVRKHLEKK